MEIGVAGKPADEPFRTTKEPEASSPERSRGADRDLGLQWRLVRPGWRRTRQAVQSCSMQDGTRNDAAEAPLEPAEFAL